MKLLGMLGGMSWTSTSEYYRLPNRGVASRLGGLHSARLLVHSVDFEPVAAMQHDRNAERRASSSAVSWMLATLSRDCRALHTTWTSREVVSGSPRSLECGRLPG